MRESGTEDISMTPKKKGEWYRCPLVQKAQMEDTQMVDMWWTIMSLDSWMKSSPTGTDHRLYPIWTSAKNARLSNSAMRLRMGVAAKLGSVMKV